MYNAHSASSGRMSRGGLTMDFNPVVVRQQSSGTYPPYVPTFTVVKEYNDIILEWSAESHIAIITLNLSLIHI